MIPLVPRRIWDTRNFAPPWRDTDASIFQYLEAQGTDLDVDLPDRARREQNTSLRFVPGALDNILNGADGDAIRICKEINRVLKHPNEPNIKSLYDALLDDDAIGVVDDAIDVFSKAPPNWERLAIFFEWLAKHSPDREPVKFAIAMLGISGQDKFTELFLTLGGHEEFTKYAAVAVANSLPPTDARVALEKLARLVNGWGRIDLVERLAPGADADFRRWLVRDGFKNSIMYEYLACIAAREGRLLEQLSDPDAKNDIALLDGAADIFIALINGGPAEDMRHYEKGVAAAQSWFDLIDAHPPTLLRASAARRLLDFAARDEKPWDEETSTEFRSRATAYIARPELRILVNSGLETGTRLDYWHAKTLASHVDIDAWPFIFDRQAKEDGDYWYDLMQTEDAARIDRVIELAMDRLPLREMASGPAQEMGFGPEWTNHSALGFIVQDLKRFPGKGWMLIASSLQSPVVRNRNMAINALAVWRKGDWPSAALPLVRRAIEDEPNAKVKDRLEALLRPDTSD